MHFTATKKLSLFLLLLLSSASFSQSPAGTLGNWFMFFNQTRLSDKWSIHTEAQYRSFNIAPNTEQLLLRGGINYHTGKSSLATAGYAYITNYAYDKEQMPEVVVFENRLWQQFIFRANIKRFFFEHRLRSEQRWILSNGNKRYLNRVRYLLRLTIPINKTVIEKNTFFVSLYDEIFINATSSPFDRNRLYGALGYQFLPNVSLQLGYLAQTTPANTKHYLQAALFYNLDFRKKQEETKTEK